MNLARFLKEERVDLDLDAAFDAEERPATVEGVADHMVGLLERSDALVNVTKLRLDLVQRERRAPSLLGHGVALPHVRTLQARRLVLAVAVSRAGLDLGAPDGEPVHLVVALVGPTYDDKLYLQVYRLLSERLLLPGTLDAARTAREPGELVRAISG